MTHCDHPDCDERETKGPPSLGVVVVDERIVRGAYDGKHYNKSGVLKAQFPRMKDIALRRLSVWRIDQAVAGDLKKARELVANHGPQDQELKDAVIFDVNHLRAMKTLDGARAFCVFDDTDIDDAGNKHADHAALGLCRLIDAEQYFNAENEVAVDLTRRLVAYANAQLQLGKVA